MASTSIGTPAGMPSTIATSACPCDSPAVRNRSIGGHSIRTFCGLRQAWPAPGRGARAHAQHAKNAEYRSVRATRAVRVLAARWLGRAFAPRRPNGPPHGVSAARRSLPAARARAVPGSRHGRSRMAARRTRQAAGGGPAVGRTLRSAHVRLAPRNGRVRRSRSARDEPAVRSLPDESPAATIARPDVRCRSHARPCRRVPGCVWHRAGRSRHRGWGRGGPLARCAWFAPDEPAEPEGVADEPWTGVRRARRRASVGPQQSRPADGTMGVRLVHRTVYDALRERLCAEPPTGISVTDVEVAPGAGGRTLLRYCAREARRLGWVAIATPALRWIGERRDRQRTMAWDDIVAGRHVVVLHDGRRSSRTATGSSRPSFSAWAHMCLARIASFSWCCGPAPRTA